VSEDEATSIAHLEAVQTAVMGEVERVLDKVKTV
jgi:phosphoglucomutase